MIEYVLEAVKGAGVEEILVVVGHQGDLVRQTLGEGYRYVLQDPPVGTGHAVMVAGEGLDPSADTVMVVCGDTPLISSGTLRTLLAHHLSEGAEATLLTARPDDPRGYGRVLRDGTGRLIGVVEETDAGPEELAIPEVNAGIYCFERQFLYSALAEVKRSNAQGEYYLPDAIALLVRQGHKVGSLEASAEEVVGVNTRADLARAEQILRRRMARRLMEGGVTLVDPETTYVETTVEVGRDTVIFPGTLLRGRTVIGEDCRIGPFTTVEDSRLGSGVVVRYAVVEGSEVADGCTIGPFAYVRPGTRLSQGVKIGGFVEVKKCQIGEGTKVPHLTYLGDAVVGERVNIGAGTITCNYDGKAKWPTYIEDEAFIGSNTNLVAPVRIGRGAYVGAGSTITKDVPPGSLGVARSRQSNIPGWCRRKRITTKEDEKQ
jgi:bifunctional UDP-N-acetylglucosamine pyrophosphorylase/glucosamine-1-phosphate N-acetyltransferase